MALDPEPEPVPHVNDEDLEQVTLPDSLLRRVPALSSAERDLHRHAGGSCNLTEPALEGCSMTLHMVPLGQFSDTYMLVEAGEELLLVDQHALHERIRYERLRHDEALWEGQRRLVPVPLDLNPRTVERVRQDRNSLLPWVLNSKSRTRWHMVAAPRLGRRRRGFLHDLLQDVGEDGAPLETLSVERTTSPS